jgi:type II secretory pathway pseudopilin PulG
MKLGGGIVAVMALAALAAGPGLAKPKERQAQSNALIDAVAACRSVADEKARLACYDAATARLAEAVRSKELVVLDRQEIGETRRSLFGFSVPNIPLFRGESGEQESQLETTIAGVGSLGQGKWQIRLQDGALWQTNESWLGLSDPRPGQKIVIKRGALGNYFLRINGQRGVRGRRVG